MQYLGEHLLPGQIGQFFAVLSLVASIVATIAYFIANKKQLGPDRQNWIRIARGAFFLETVSVMGMFVVLYYIISNHLFEYKYAWQHSDRSLQIEYLLSCFWEGQEGSFMLWSFWHCIGLDIDLEVEAMGSWCNDCRKFCTVHHCHNDCWDLFL